MEWVKKNLGFVIGLAVAVILLGAGIWYSLGTMGEASTTDGELQAKKQQLDDLVKRDPFPDQSNITLAKAEEERVNAFVLEARKKFDVRKIPEGLDNASFKSLLETTLTNLVRDADRAGVKLPTPYNFTFEDQRKQLQLPSASLIPLTAHLENLDAICRILFDAKVHSLVSLKRSSVGADEMKGTGDILNQKVSTNSTLGAVVYPYEVVFQGFSQELAKVFNGFVNAPEAYVIKTMNVERGSLDSGPSTASTAPMMIPGMPPGMDPMLARRYGLGRPSAQAPMAPPPPVANRPGEVVLDEKPLKVTLGIEVVSLLPAKEKDREPARERRRGNEGEAPSPTAAAQNR